MNYETRAERVERVTRRLLMAAFAGMALLVATIVYGLARYVVT